jgi:hypothetical protein
MCQLSSHLVTQLAIILTDIEEIARHLKLQTFLSPAAFRLAFTFMFCSNGDPSWRRAGHAGQHAAPNRGQAFAEGEEASRHPLIDRSHAKAAKVLPSTALTVALGVHGGVASTKTCLAVACRREALPMCRDNDPR